MWHRLGGLLFAVLASAALPHPCMAAAEGGPPVRLEVVDLPDWRQAHHDVPPEVTGGWADSIRAEGLRIAAHPTAAFRHATQLALRLQNGRFALLHDVMAPVHWGSGLECCESAFRYIAFWDDVGFHVVESASHHHEETVLVSVRTAEVATLIGSPHRVPGRPELAVAILTSDMLGHDLEVWRLGEGRWLRIQHCPAMPYGTEFVRWDADGHIVLRRLGDETDMRGERIWVEEPYRLDGDRLDLPTCR